MKGNLQQFRYTQLVLFHVLPEGARGPLASGLTYDSDVELSPGMLVSVPLRKRIVSAVVTGHAGSSSQFAVRSIQRSKPIPIVQPPAIAAVRKYAEEIFCHEGELLESLLPEAPWSLLHPQPLLAVAHGVLPRLRSAKQGAVVAHLQEHGPQAFEQLHKAVGVTSASVRLLIAKGILEEQWTVREDRGQKTEDGSKRHQTLVTCSSPYRLLEETAATAKESLASEGNVLIIVPQISDVADIVSYLSRQIPGSNILAYHSGISSVERRAVWQQCMLGKARIVVTTRVGVLLPLQNLRSIIVYREHDERLLSERFPYIHAREFAFALAHEHSANLLLATCSPSVAAWSRVEHGALVHKHEKQEVQRPTVEVIDLNTSPSGDYYPLSPALLRTLEATIANGKRSLLFFNRRGMGTMLRCQDCKTAVSGQSGVPLSVIRAGTGVALRDYANGKILPLPECCPTCSGLNLRVLGAGTQKIEQLVRTLFPTVSVARIDADAASMKSNAQIIVGTERVLPLLDDPAFTFVAVVLADVGLNTPTFRAAERCYHLLTDLLTRGPQENRSFTVQTYMPAAPEIQAAVSCNPALFLRSELDLRRKTELPPTTPLLHVRARSDESIEGLWKRTVPLLSAFPGVTCAKVSIDHETVLEIRGEHAANVLTQIGLRSIFINPAPYGL